MPNRIIKESIRTSKNVNALSDFEFRVWLYLITYVDDYGRGSADPELLKGMVFPRRKGVTENQIASALRRMASFGMVNLYEVDGESYFCFPKWESHQRIQSKRSKFPDPPLLTVTHGDSPSESNPIQSNPNPNTESNPNPNPNVTHVRARETDFDRFWAMYPKKVGKKDAFKAFIKADASIDEILDAVDRQMHSAQWQREGGRFIPNPATWLRQGRWDDEIQDETPSSGMVFVELAREAMMRNDAG